MNTWIVTAIIYVDGQGESGQVIKFHVLKFKAKKMAWGIGQKGKGQGQWTEARSQTSYLEKHR